MTQDKTRAKTKEKGKPLSPHCPRTSQITPQVMSIDALLEAFHVWLESRDRSAHSIRAYLSDVKQFAEWFNEHTKQPFTLDAVTNDDVRAWRDELEEIRQPASVNRKLAALSAFYRWADEAGRVGHDPTAHVNGVEQQPIAPKALAKNDVNRILREARKGGKRDEAILELLAATGLRVSELAKLRIGDLDLGERHGWVTVNGKGRKQRRVPVHAKARQVLREYLAERDQVEPGDPLFETQKGTPMTSYTVWYTVKKYAAQAGVKNVTPHTFRHTVATQLVRDPEVDIVTAATILGHSRLDTTARYAQPNEDDLAKAAERLE